MRGRGNDEEGVLEGGDGRDGGTVSACREEEEEDEGRGGVRQLVGE